MHRHHSHHGDLKTIELNYLYKMRTLKCTFLET